MMAAQTDLFGTDKADYRIHFDGGSLGNPGPAACGVFITSSKGKETRIGLYIGRATNNIAEYIGLITALEEAASLDYNKIQIFTDSELVYRQIKGEYKVKNERLKPLFIRAKSLIDRLKSVELVHVPRERNTEADKIVKRVFRQAKMAAPLVDGGEESPGCTGEGSG